jgi:hypothetical protein
MFYDYKKTCQRADDYDFQPLRATVNNFRPRMTPPTNPATLIALGLLD